MRQAHSRPGKVITVLAVLAVLAGVAPVIWAAPAAAAPVRAPQVQAAAALLADGTTGRTLFSRAARARRSIASITKVMTAMVVLRRGGLGRVITIKAAYVDYAYRNGATTAHLRAGERLTAHQLLYGMLLPSGTDAAYALADSYGPGVRRFVARMNATARAVGLRDTYFSNFDGLAYPAGHLGYSTARDVTAMGRWAMRDPWFRALAGTARYRIAAGHGHDAHTWRTTNLLLGAYHGVIGIKTGYTDQAGYCLLFAARRGSRYVVGVVLDSSLTDPGARFADAAALLNWVFGVRAAGRASGTGPPGPGSAAAPRGAEILND